MINVLLTQMHGSPERREKNILVIHSLNLIWFYESRRAPEVLPILVSSEISSAVQWCASPSLGQNKYYSNQHWEIWTWINIEKLFGTFLANRFSFLSVFKTQHGRKQFRPDVKKNGSPEFVLLTGLSRLPYWRYRQNTVGFSPARHPLPIFAWYKNTGAC